MMRRPSAAAGVLLCLLCVLPGCVTQTRTGPPPPSAAAAEAARRAELRFRARAHTDLASAYYERRQYAVALEELDVAQQVDPSYASAWSLRGLVFMALREDREAEEAFLKGTRLAPNDSELANNYGYFLCNRGRAREGLSKLEAVIRDPLYPTPEKALVNAGSCSLALHDDVAAEDLLRQALRIRPTEPQAALTLARLQDGKGRAGEARETLRPLLRGDAPPREALQLLVELDRKLQDPEQLRLHAELLQKLYPETPAAQPKPQEVRP